MITTNLKIEFVFAMAKHSDVPLNHLKRVMRHAATVQRLAETACNRELTVQEILKDENAQADIIALIAEYDCAAVFSGDPRGACVKIQVPDDYTNDWGNEGICVPA